MLYLFNNMEVPTYFVTGMGKWWHSVSMYAGTNDALVQWWYGHNAVAFVFTVGIIAQFITCQKKVVSRFSLINSLYLHFGA